MAPDQFSSMRQFLIDSHSTDAMTAEMVAACLSALQQGHTISSGASEVHNGWICEGSLQAFARAERYIATWVQRSSELDRSVSHAEAPSTNLSAEQARAVLKAVDKKLFLLEGGPGTGKTYCAAEIITCSNVKSWLALAPTGKAKAQLEASLYRQGIQMANVMTLQAALARETRPTGFFSYDLILVDESSMIDSVSFWRLLKAVGNNTRIILLGDRYQLPPVGPGQPFFDLCRAYQGSALHHRLTKSHRTAVTALRQRADELLDQCTCSADCTLPVAAEFAARVLRFHQRSLPYQPVQLMAALTERMVLGALQEGPWGAQQVAECLQTMTVDEHHPWRPMPILILNNAEAIDLWNGDLGWLCRPQGDRAFALFAGRNSAPWSCDEGYRRIPVEALPPWAPAWVMTVHKSQGSEFDDIAIVLPPGAESFGRPLLYTALTRAKQSAEIWATKDQLRQTCLNEGLRDTLLQRSLGASMGNA